MPVSTCPECQSAMRIMEKGNVHIDVCPSCRGVWLDGGELERILADTRRHEAERLGNARYADGGSGPRDRDDGRGGWFENIGDVISELFD